MRGDVLELPLRKRITEYVRINPGVHFRKTARDLDLAIGQADFHFNALVKAEVLIRQEEGGNVRFYVRDRFTPQERKMISVLRKEIPRGIVLYLLENPRTRPSEVLNNFSFTAATLSYHLRRMEKQGILEAVDRGRERFYSVKEPDTVKGLLLLYRTTLFDTILDRVI